MECTDDYVMGEVPAAVKVLTLTCDVQLDRLIYVIRGWGAGGTSWLVEARELYGMTEGEEVWDTFANVLTDTYDGLPIRLALVDSGYRPGKKFLVPEHRVYAFARRFPHLVRATKARLTRCASRSWLTRSTSRSAARKSKGVGSAPAGHRLFQVVGAAEDPLGR